MRLATSAAVLALSLALAGCSDSEPAAAPEASPTAAQGGQGAQTYATTAELLAALEAAGLPCSEPMTGDFEGVTEAQSCILNDAEDVVLLRFADDAEKQAYTRSKDELASAVVGENWAVQTVLPPTAEQVAAALGGEVLAGAGEQPTG